MKSAKDGARREFLKTMSASVPAAALLSGNTFAQEKSGSVRAYRSEPTQGKVIDLGSEITGDDAIPFRKHTLDLGCCETVTVADINCDGRLDIVSGENWYEQIQPEPGRGPRFIKHKFRELGYTD